MLAALVAATGVDVRYIITGRRDGPPPEALAPDERVLLDGYRALDPATRKRLLAFVLGGESTASAPKVVVHGGTGTQIETNRAPINIDMRTKGK